MILRELLVKLGFDVEEEGLHKFFSVQKLLDKGIDTLIDKTAEFIDDIGKMIDESAKAGAELEELSQQTGISTEALQNLTHAAAFSGVSVQSMTTSLGILSRNLYAASKGGEQQAKAFSALGVKTHDANGKLKTADLVVLEIAEKFKKMPDGIEKTALSMKAFGRSGKELIPFLNEGKEGIAELAAQTTNLTEAQIKASKELLRAQRIGQAKSDNFWLTSVQQAVPGMLSFQKDMNEMWSDIRAAAKPVVEWMFSAIGTGLKLVGIVAQGVGHQLNKLAKNWTLIAGIMLLWNGRLILSYVRMGIAAAATAIRVAVAWAAAVWPFVLIAAALAALYIAFDDVRVYLEGGDSLIGRYIDKIKKWINVNYDDSPFMIFLKQAVSYLTKMLDLIIQAGVATGQLSNQQLDKLMGKGAAEVRKDTNKITVDTAKKRVGMGQKLTREESAALSAEGIDQKAFVAQYAPAPSARGRGGAAAPVHRSSSHGGVHNSVKQVNHINVTVPPGTDPDTGKQMVKDALSEHMDEVSEQVAATYPAVP